MAGFLYEDWIAVCFLMRLEIGCPSTGFLLGVLSSCWISISWLGFCTVAGFPQWLDHFCIVAEFLDGGPFGSQLLDPL